MWSKGAYGVKGHGSEVDRDGFKTKLAHAGLGLGVRWLWSGVAHGVEEDEWRETKQGSVTKQWSETTYGVKWAGMDLIINSHMLVLD